MKKNLRSHFSIFVSHLLSLSLFLSFLNPALAQTKLLTMDEAMLGFKKELAPEKLKQMTWVKGCDDFSYVETRDKNEILVRASASSKLKMDVVSKDELNVLMRPVPKLKIGPDSLAAFPVIEWQNPSEFTFECRQSLWTYNLTKKTLVLTAGRGYRRGFEHVDSAPVTGYSAYTVKNNLYVLDGITDGVVTADTNINIVNGQSVHREEFGITKGTFWSPKGDKLAFYRMDQTMVEDYPIIDWTTKPAKVKNIKYPMAGQKSHAVTVGVYDTQTGTSVFLLTPKPEEDHYLTNIAWSPDQKHIYIAELNRNQNWMNLNSYNALNGKFEKTLFVESNEKYTEPLHPVLFVKNNPGNFVWQSRRDGWNHLYLYDLNGLLVRQLTSGQWEVTEVLGFDARGENLFFTSTKESPISNNVYSVHLKDGKIKRLTQGEGMHQAFFSESGSYFIDQFTGIHTPLETAVYSTEGKKLRVILNSSDPLKDYQLGQVKLFKLKNSGGPDLYCRMFLPIHFDSAKKYPVIVYQYGGPHVQLINSGWNYGCRDYWFQYMAEQGYVVFTLDPRGSGNRGQEFEQATFRKLGSCEMEDQLSGVKYLKSHSWVDSTRMGLFGWSFGGFMTCSIMTRYPGVFKAAVAGGPVIDWDYYEVMYTERYMDSPQENPKGYTDSNVLNYVDNLQGKLLLIHGTSDPVVVQQHTMMFLKAAIDKKKQVDYFLYPGHEHNVTGKDRVNLYTKVTDYFKENL